MAIVINEVKLKRGNQTAVANASLFKGEPAIAMDTRELFIGTSESGSTSKIKISDVVVVDTYADLPGSGEQNKLYLVITDETFSPTPETSLYVFKAAQYVLVTCGTGNLTVSDISDFNTGVDTIIDNRRGANDGIAPLNTGGKIPNEYLPNLAVTDVHVVNDDTERLALGLGTSDAGDLVVVTGTNKTWIYTGSDYVELLTAGNGVMDVNGDSGPSVTLDADDISDMGTTNKWFTDARARQATIDGSINPGEAGSDTYAWPIDRVKSELDGRDNNLGSLEINEAGLAGGTVITYNAAAVPPQLEYHAIIIDGGDL